MSNPTILYCDASHHRLTGGVLTAVAGIAVATEDGEVLAVKELRDVSANAAERRAIRLAADMAELIAGPVEIRNDAVSAVAGMRQWVERHARDGVTLTWKRRRYNTADAPARRTLRAALAALEAHGYRANVDGHAAWPRPRAEQTYPEGRNAWECVSCGTVFVQRRAPFHCDVCRNRKGVRKGWIARKV